MKIRFDPPDQTPALAAGLASLLTRPDPYAPDLPPSELRRLFEAAFGALPKLGEAVGDVRDVRLAVDGGAEIPLRVYRPGLNGLRPTVLYVHGGGWTVGSVDSHDDVCRSLCHRAGAVVVSVGYRLAPEHPFPVPLEDVAAALRWCARNAPSLGGDPARLVVAGDSAGGNLAAALALRVRDLGGPRLAGQVLIYPALACDFSTGSYRAFAEGYGLTRAKARLYWESYTAKGSRLGGPYVTPLAACDLRGLPPTLVVTAHFDPVRDDGEAYALRLWRADVPVRCTRYTEANHAFLHCGAFVPAAQRALDEIAAAVSGFPATGSNREGESRTLPAR